MHIKELTIFQTNSKRQVKYYVHINEVYMASKDSMLFDDDIDEMDDTEQEDTDNITSDKSKLDTRRRLEEYMEMKKLRELIDY